MNNTELSVFPMKHWTYILRRLSCITFISTISLLSLLSHSQTTVFSFSYLRIEVGACSKIKVYDSRYFGVEQWVGNPFVELRTSNKEFVEKRPQRKRESENEERKTHFLPSLRSAEKHFLSYLKRFKLQFNNITFVLVHYKKKKYDQTNDTGLTRIRAP